MKERKLNIEGDGFLSESGQEKARKIIDSNKHVFIQIDRIISEIRSFLSSHNLNKQDTEEELQRVIALVLAVRILEISEAIYLVMRNGMSNEANTLFRVFLDAYFVFANVCSDSSFVANYFTSDEVTRLKLINVAKKHSSEMFEAINEYATETLRDELKNRIFEENIQTFNSYVYADNVGCAEIYDSMYRITSSPLHTTPRSLEKYVEEDAEGKVVMIKDYPLEGDIPDRAYDLAYFLIKVISGLREAFGCLVEQDIQSMIDRLNEAVKDVK